MKFRLVLWVLLLGSLCPGPVWAAETQMFKGEIFEGGPWIIKADTLTYHADTKTYEASGRVEIRQGERRLSADYMKVHGPTKIAEIRGNAVMVLGEDILTGKAGQFNLVTRSGELTDARIFIRRNHFHINSALIRKTGEDTYYTEKSVITTCDSDRPMWSFYSRELEVKIDGYAVGKKATLRLGPVPVAVLPKAVLPVKTTRQSGFLMPHYSQHQLNGIVVELPFYWAINNYMDATFYPMIVSHRGFMQSEEFRYAWDKESGGTARFSYIDDHKSSAPTRNRYWGVAMFNQSLPRDWNARGVLDLPSDSQYLYDFDFGYQSLGRLNRALLNDYGRNLEQYDVKTRVSGLILERPFGLGSFNFYGQYYRSLSSLIPHTINKVPSLQAGSLLVPLGKTPLSLLINSEYTNYYQPHGLSGQRIDFHPRLALNKRILNAVTIDAIGGWRGTGYMIDSGTTDKYYFYKPDPDKFVGRSLFDIKTSISSPLFRDWGRTEDAKSFVRHIFIPKVSYYNISNFDLYSIPKFDPFDYGWQTKVTKNYPIFEGFQPIAGVNAVTCTLTNHLIRRSTTSTGLPQIRELFWSRITQSFFFNSSSYGLDTLPQPHHRVSDVFVETLGYPVENIGIGLNGGFSPYKDGVSQLDARLILRDPSQRYILNLDYVYFKNYANQINSQLFLDLFRSFKIGIANQHTFTSGRQLENKYQLIFQRQCWGVAFTFADRPQDKYVSATIIIPGLVERFRVPAASQPNIY